MTDKNEFRGKTVEEAIERAMIELGVAREYLQVEILSQGPHSMLGMGTTDAVVRVTSTAPPPTPVKSAPVSEPLEPEPYAQQTLATLLKGMGLDSQVVVKKSELGEDGPEFVLARTRRAWACRRACSTRRRQPAGCGSAPP